MSKTETYTVDCEVKCACGKGIIKVKKTYEEPENPVYDQSSARLIRTVKLSTTCPDNCEKL